MCKRFLPLTFLFVLGTAVSSFAQMGGSMAGMVSDYLRMEDRNSVKGKTYKRMSIGYGRHFVDNSMVMTLITPDETKQVQNVHLETKGSLAAYSSFFAPISRMGEQTAVVFDYGVSFASWMFRYDSVTFITPNYHGTFSSDIPVIYGAVPLSIDFKTGGEVSLRKEHKHLFTAGVGIAPMIIMNDAAMRFAAKPFLKLEAGFHAGIAFKVRGMFYVGEGKFINDEGVVGSSIDGRKSTGNFGSSIGLVVMPFSWDWEKGW